MFRCIPIWATRDNTRSRAVPAALSSTDMLYYLRQEMSILVSHQSNLIVPDSVVKLK